MKPEWRRFAPWGYTLALVAVIAAIGLYIVFQQFNLYIQISLAIVVFGILIAIILDPARARAALTGRQARYGSNLVVLVLAFIGVLVIVNYLVYDNNQRWDLTEDQENTLATETIELLSNLRGPVTVRAFYTTRISKDSAEQLLDQYAYESDGQFRYEFIDPEQDPVIAQEAGITRDGTIVLEMEGNTQQVEVVSEQELTGALIRLMTPDIKYVYFLTGHGEISPKDTGDRSYSQLQGRLIGKNYRVDTLNLLAQKQIPPDATVIIVGGPTQPVSLEEVELLKEFVNQGGALIVMQEPLPVTDFGESPDPLAEYLDESWGVTLGKDIIVDLSSQQAFIAVADQYGNHPITQKLSGLVTLYPTARTIALSSAIDAGVSQVNLVQTADQSWAETDFTSLAEGNLRADEGVDQVGPLSVAVAAELFSSGARIVVFGDAEFPSNAYFSAYGNSDMMINAIDWVVGEEELINLTPKTPTQRVLVPPQTYTLGLILLGSVFVLPGLIVLAGVYTWFARRRRG